MNDNRNSIEKRIYRRRLERMMAKKRHRRIVMRRRLIALAILIIAVVLIVSVITVTGQEEKGPDTSHGVIYFTDEPEPDGAISGASKAVARAQLKALNEVSEETHGETHENARDAFMADPAAGAPEIIETELISYDIPDDYKAQGGYLPLDLQWHILDLLISYGIEDEYPTAIAMYEQETGYQPKKTGKHGDKGGFQVVEEYHKDRMERLGVTDLYDIYQNSTVAMDYYAELWRYYDGNRVKALTAYNGGHGAVISGKDTGYAKKVIARAERIKKEMEMSGTHYTRFHFVEDEL